MGYVKDGVIYITNYALVGPVILRLAQEAQDGRYDEPPCRRLAEEARDDEPPETDEATSTD